MAVLDRVGLATPSSRLPGMEIEVVGLRDELTLADADRHAMGSRGRQLVQERFTWPIVAEQMRGVLESVV